MRLTLKTIEERVAQLAGKSSYDREFLFDLLGAYGRSPSNITRLRNGSLNLSKDPATEVLQKGQVYLRETQGDLLEAITEVRTSPAAIRYSPRFVIVTDYHTLVAVDMKTSETLAAPIADIDKHVPFFLPWAGMEKAQYVAESHADVKAAERMAKLFDELLAANPELRATAESRHGLNVFFTRLLFCFFAEDTGIFAPNQFTNALSSLTQEDGSDVHELLTDLFTALDTRARADRPTILADFPYVNGRLFRARPGQDVPVFTRKARELLIQSGTLLWSEINPDIFGSMFQAVVAAEQRSDLGQHYTSVPNILKTIEPLFLDELKEELGAAFDDAKKLNALLARISAIRVFDPACGSGNFLVIAYKELRKLEHAILDRLFELTGDAQGGMLGSRIGIENFYGIEIDDFAVEVAVLSLWIAKHQMNIEFREKFGVDLPLIPLRESGQIHHGNAARVDWNEVCPNNGTDEIYLIGNPPYAGARNQTPDQKADYQFALSGLNYSKNLDYVALWFLKGATYISGANSALAFVATNSVSQGEHVSLLFPLISKSDVEVGFAFVSFPWENNARRNAGVTVAVIGLRPRSSKAKYIFDGDLRTAAGNINGYLVDAPDTVVSRRTNAVSPVMPPMSFGNMALDDGNLLLTTAERDELTASSPNSSTLIRRLFGSKEFINGIERWCLWITDDNVDRALSDPLLKVRIDGVRVFRQSSKDSGTIAKANRPWSFREQKQSAGASILIPRHSSASRDYVPLGYLGANDVIGDSANAIYNAKPWVFALVTARIHMVWLRAVGGRLKTDYRYSNTIVYNNFPVPEIGERKKEKLTEAAFRVLDVREYHSERTLAELYDPHKMPDDLRLAHQELDDLVDSIYRKKPFDSDEERLAHLFTLYETMIAAEEAAKPAPKKKRTPKAVAAPAAPEGDTE